MNLFGLLGVSGSALTAERVRAEVAVVEPVVERVLDATEGVGKRAGTDGMIDDGGSIFPGMATLTREK